MMRRRIVFLVPLGLAACDMGTYTPGRHHGGDEATVGSRLTGVDSGATDAAGASTAVNGHFGAGTTATGKR